MKTFSHNFLRFCPFTLRDLCKFVHNFFLERKEKKKFPASYLAPVSVLLCFCCCWSRFPFFMGAVQKSAGLTIIDVDFSEYPEPFQ